MDTSQFYNENSINAFHLYDKLKILNTSSKKLDNTLSSCLIDYRPNGIESRKTGGALL